jgi:hypothetical protein
MKTIQHNNKLKKYLLLTLVITTSITIQPVTSQDTFHIPQMFPKGQVLLPEDFQPFKDEAKFSFRIENREVFVFAPGYPYILCYETRTMLFSWKFKIRLPEG